MTTPETPVEKKSKSLHIKEWVFGIIVVLLLIFILTPATSTPMKTPPRIRAGYDVRQIALSYIYYAQGSGKSRNIQHGDSPRLGQATNPAQYAEVLARFSGLAAGEVWYIESDDALSDKPIPANVLSDIDDGENLLQKTSPISWAVVLNARKNLIDKYPLIWTRGLQENGTWSETSPWSREGGHIAFGDGHMRWYDNLNLEGNRLESLADEAETSNYRDAIGPNAIAAEDFTNPPSKE